jgi:hypothetical protein
MDLTVQATEVRSTEEEVGRKTKALNPNTTKYPLAVVFLF